MLPLTRWILAGFALIVMYQSRKPSRWWALAAFWLTIVVDHNRFLGIIPDSSAFNFPDFIFFGLTVLAAIACIASAVAPLRKLAVLSATAYMVVVACSLVVWTVMDFRLTTVLALMAILAQIYYSLTPSRRQTSPTSY